MMISMLRIFTWPSLRIMVAPPLLSRASLPLSLLGLILTVHLVELDNCSGLLSVSPWLLLVVQWESGLLVTLVWKLLHSVGLTPLLSPLTPSLSLSLPLSLPVSLSLALTYSQGAAKIQAKDLVRTRRHVEKFYKMKTQLQAVSLRMQTMKSTLAMTDAMKGVAKVMGRMNAQMNMPAMQRIMMEFEKQNEMLDMKEEMMGDTIDDVMDSEGEEEETEEVISKVLDEIGISLDGQLADTPNQAIPQQQVEVAKKEEDDLQARLDNLRKG
eukprot:TRINITY_DN59_c1_g2_i3.p1 TRINITY_DN59_c1_g2~~TRINITY_DN59_c1_g2_i3.p1  ORF type:complete len:269 (+),score=42.97 TRINITY_DN59_c1_g2_i3:91-897(+)